jgi:hypothetical protein
MAHELCNRLADAMNAAVLFRRKPENPFRVIIIHSMLGVICFNEIVDKCRLSISVGSRNENMRRVIQDVI